ncbi:Nn.00g055300.m01.CDS01 [Neocucurbitaria sp. VM-36]
MAPRHMCPSMGALRRSILIDVAALPTCSSRALHSSTRRLEEQPSNGASPAPPTNTRKARSATALKQITSLQNRRIIPGALARGSFPSGQMARRNPRPQSGQNSDTGLGSGDTQSSTQREASTRNARFARSAANPAATRGSAPPSGQMARAPSKLRISRSPTVGGMRGGPNLRGRDGNRDQGNRRGGPNNRGDRGPKKREKNKAASSAPQRTSIADINPATTLSDGMVHHLLRLQRKEWDRVPYEPKYAKGSFAANELIHTGRELFKGESPPVKIWGSLEKRIGVVGMFGAEAHLKIRRVGDGDAEAFGQEVLEVEEDVKEAKQGNKGVAAP